MWRKLMKINLIWAKFKERQLHQSGGYCLHGLLKASAEITSMTNSYAIQPCRILHWELVIWELHRKPEVLVFGEVVKKGVPWGSHCAMSTTSLSLAEMQEERFHPGEGTCRTTDASPWKPSSRSASLGGLGKAEPQGTHLGAGWAARFPFSSH